MKITLYAEELIKRCLWDNYVYYIVNSEKEAEKIYTDGKEIEISERDALIIGLLKVIETDNLIFKFNTFIAEILANKSIKNNDHTLIKKKTFDSAVDKFLDKFPDYWEPNLAYAKALKDLVNYINDIKSEVEKLEIHVIIDKNITYEFYNSNIIKKMLKFNY